MWAADTIALNVIHMGYTALKGYCLHYFQASASHLRNMHLNRVRSTPKPACRLDDKVQTLQWPAGSELAVELKNGSCN